MTRLSYAEISSMNVADRFFDSLREDYPGFDDWFRRKAAENAYVAVSNAASIEAFLYLKIEEEPVTDVTPMLPQARRLKVGTFKVNPHGTLLGERLIKKLFDHALQENVDEIYVTVFPKHERLIQLFERYGFTKVAEKTNATGIEDVLSRSLRSNDPDMTKRYPRIALNGRKYLLAIYPQFHSRLFPDSKLATESPDIVKDVSHANSIRKVYLTRMNGISDLRPGDLLAIYRTSDNQGPAEYRSVVTSICTVEELRHIRDFENFDEFQSYCEPHSVFTPQELQHFWATKQYPFIIRFLYNAALPKRPNRRKLLDLAVIARNDYTGFASLTNQGFSTILQEGMAHADLVIDQT